MKRYRFTLFLIVALGLFASLKAQQIHPDYVDGELFWRLKAGEDSQLPDSILMQYQVQEMGSPFTMLNPDKLNGNEIIDQLHRTFLLRFDNHTMGAKLASYLASLKATELVEKVPLVTMDLSPNDPAYLLNQQWHLAQIFADTAWGLSLGNPNVRVAIVDDAVRTSHPDVAGSIWMNTAEQYGISNWDDDGNGTIDDVNGYDVADGDNNPNPPLPWSCSVFTHGTHCAGIAGAMTSNGLGIASIGFGIKIIPVKCKKDASTGAALPFAYAGLAYAISLQPEVISLSWGGYGSSTTIQNIFNLAAANDIVVVAAAGNSNVSTPMYPASYGGVISVAATDVGDVKAGFSNFGPTIDVSAPGVNIHSTLAGGCEYGPMSGTSMATPLVAGLCALMRSYNPNMTASQIEACLKSTTDNIDPQNLGYVSQLGTGRIHALHALQCVSSTPVAAFTQSATNVCPGSTVQFTDQSYGTPTSWNWSFPGGSPSASTLQNPLVTYGTTGTYAVTLIISNGNGSDTVTFSSIIVATPTATLSGNVIINLGSPALLTVNFTGTPPFSFTYTNGSTNFTVNTILTNTYTLTVTPSVTTSYTLVSMSNVQCSGTVSGSGLVTISGGCAATSNFQQIMGGTLMDNPYAVKQTPDCGYIVAGTTVSYGTGLSDAVLAKLHPDGTLDWFKTYGRTLDHTTFTDVAPVSNGYAAVGFRIFNGQAVVYVVKTHLDGSFWWHKHLRYSSSNSVWAIPGEIVEMADGNLAVAYSAARFPLNSSGQAMAMLDGANGNVLWQRNEIIANVKTNDGSSGILRNASGQLVAAGYSRFPGYTAGLFDMGIVKRNSSGGLIWSKNYGGSSNDYGSDIVELKDKGYLMVGYTQSYGASIWDILIVRTDSMGQLVWAKKYGRPAADLGIKIVAGCNGKYFVAGQTRSTTTGNDALLFQIDLSGNILWAKAIGGPYEDGDVVSLAPTGDCGCALTASTISYGAGETDYLIVKSDSIGTISCHSEPVTLTVQSVTPSVYNAPVNSSNTPTYPGDTTTVQSHSPIIPDSVCDACGAPIADFDYVTNVFTIACIDNSVNGQSWSWSFGDGTALDTMRNPVHAYTSPGTYAVTVVVSNPCGIDTLSRTVTITGLSECLHVMQPGPVKGYDADVNSMIFHNNSNGGGSPYYNVATWTWNSIPGTIRSYLKFDLSRICHGATLLDGRLSTWYDPTIGQPHSGANSAYLSPCMAPWGEYTITWNTQPAVGASLATVPVLTGAVNLSNLNVTTLFQYLITGPNNYGFQWRHQAEGPYRRTIFNSSDHYDPQQRPKLTLKFDPIYAYATAQPSGAHSAVICRGDSVQLNLAGYTNGSTTSGPSTATSYLWIPSTGLSCTTCPDPWASPDSTITYRAIAYNCPSCADIDTVRVTVSRVSAAAPNATVCVGDTVQLHAFHPIPGTTFSWTPTTTLSPANSQHTNVWPTSPTSYIATATDSINGCISKDTVDVAVGFPSQVPALIGDTILDCDHGWVQFPLNPPFTAIGGDYYEWNLIPNITPDPHSPNAHALINTNIHPAIYYFVLTVSNTSGCTTHDIVRVEVECLPANQIQFFGESQSHGNLLTWRTDIDYHPDHFNLERSADGIRFDRLNTTAYDNRRDYTHLDAQPLQGNNFYRIQVVDANGSESFTETILLNKEMGTAITLYPNPTSGKVTLNAFKPLSEARIVVMDALGKELQRIAHITGNVVSLDLSNNAPGMYSIRVTDMTGLEATWRVVKE